MLLRSLLLLVLLLRCEAGLSVQPSPCAPACGAHGSCRDGVCECEVGWAGKGCTYFVAEDAAPTPSHHVALSPAVLQLLEEAANVSAGASSQTAAPAKSAFAEPPQAEAETKRAPATPTDAAGATANGAIRVAREAVLAVSRTAELLAPTGLRGGLRESAALLQKPSKQRATKCEADCSGHGSCQSSGACKCHEGWTGSLCDMPLCPSNCNNRGMCMHGKCICKNGWYGAACHIQRCPNDCSGAGYCFQGKCMCNEGFDGADCTQATSGRGSVVVKLKRSGPTDPQTSVGGLKAQLAHKFAYGEEGPWALPNPAFPW
mmetsp:Transcript_42125/g.78303  ORF Transcript_42125/g.78303 Transcript_42125/m.78303 type:complete len:317 (+) Transcript_42125:122-1072(+)